MSKANRLQSRQDFQAVYREGIRRNTDHLTLRALKPKVDSVLSPTQIGISISLKVSKRAVIRNRIKRQLKGAFRQLLLQLAPGWRLVVVVQPSAAQECDYEQFLQELKQLLAAAEVLNGHS